MMLLRNMPEPSNSQARRIRDEVQTLLQVAAVQQAESSASRHRGAATEKRDEPAQNEKEVSVHQRPPPLGKKTTLVLHHPIDNQRRHDARRDIDENRRRRYGDTEERGYSALAPWPASRNSMASFDPATPSLPGRKKHTGARRNSLQTRLEGSIGPKAWGEGVPRRRKTVARVPQVAVVGKKEAAGLSSGFI